MCVCLCFSLSPSCLPSIPFSEASHADDPAGGLSLLGSDRLCSPPPCTRSPPAGSDFRIGEEEDPSAGLSTGRSGVRGGGAAHITFVCIYAGMSVSKQCKSLNIFKQTKTCYAHSKTPEERGMREWAQPAEEDVVKQTKFILSVPLVRREDIRGDY